MSSQKETLPFHKTKDSQTLHPVFFLKQTNKKKKTKKIGENERVKGIKLQRVLIWSKHTSYNSDLTKLLLGKGHGLKHTLMSESVWRK